MTIKSITAGLSKMVDKLGKFNAKSLADEQSFNEISNTYSARASAAKRDAEDAARIAKKISTLIE